MIAQEAYNRLVERATVVPLAHGKQARVKKPRKNRDFAASCGAVQVDETDGVGFEPTDAFRRQ